MDYTDMDDVFTAALKLLAGGHFEFLFPGNKDDEKRLIARSPYVIEKHRHLEMIFSVKGSPVLFLVDGVYTLKPNHLYVICPGTLHSQAINERCAEYEALWLIMNKREVFSTRTGHNARRGHFVEREIYSYTPINCNLLEFFAQDIRHDFIKQATLQTMLMETFIYAASQQPSEQKSARDNLFHAIIQVKHYIQNYYWRHITVDSLAASVFLSSGYLSSAFKKQVGVSVIELLLRTRLTQAKNLMINNNMTIKAIAHSVGFKDELYFSRLFKKREGCSPSAYIKKFKK